MRTRIIALGCLGLFVIIALLIGGIALFAASIPPVTQQLPNSAPLLVNLTTPLDSGDVPLDSPTSIQASALGTQSIASLELWVDGNPAETKAARGDGLKQFDAFWSWQPDAPGAHTLVVRATDAAHHVVNSNVVRVNATAGLGSSVAVNYRVQPGDTLASIAQKSGATLSELTSVNPQMNVNASIMAGQTISIPYKSKPAKTGSASKTVTATVQAPPLPPATPQATAQGSSPQASSPLAGISFWAKKNFAKDALLPAAPLLSASASGCAAMLDFTNVADNADGISVYRTGAGNPQFTRIATLGAPPKGQNWSYTDDKVTGPLEYYVAALNTLGETPSKIVSLNITEPACELQYALNPIFKGGQIVPTQPIDKVYCYLAENSGAWSRVPPAPNTFIFPTNGVFDVSAYLKTLAGNVTSQMTMDLDCWGWRGGSLTYLGEAKQTFAPQSNAGVQFVGDKFKFVGALNQPSVVKPLDPTFFIFPPNTLASTGDPTVCTGHMDPLTVLFGGAQLCESAIQNHYAVLTWNWANGLAPNGQTAIADIEGYRVYENDFYFQHSLAATTTAGPVDKVTMFQLPVIPPLRRAESAEVVSAASASLNRCFVARAYKGTVESDDSNTFCIGGLPGTKTVELNPSVAKTLWNYYTNNCSTPDLRTVWGGQLTVGYWFEENSRDVQLPCAGGHDNTVLRTILKFDTSQIGVVSRAVLKYKLSPGTTYGDNEDGHDLNRLQIPAQSYVDRSCAVELMLPTQAWDPARFNLVPADDYISLPDQGSDFQVDVTSAVGHWHSFGGNYGFELRGASEDTGSEENSQCTSEFGGFVLEVTYFPSSTPAPNLAPPGQNPVAP